MHKWISAFVPVALAAIAGCAASHSDPLPTYPNVDGPAAEKILADRAAAIHNVSGKCALTLTRGDGQTIHLDALIAIAPPDRLRLRAWKMDQVVFDLTVRPDGVWIEIPGQAPDKNDVVPATLHTAQLSRDLLWFNGGFFSSKGLSVQAQAEDSDSILFSRDVEDHSEMICEVDRKTLAPREYRLTDSTGVVRFSVFMDEYRSFPGGIVWPTHMTASNLSDNSRIDVLLSDLEFNEELPPQALTPPPHAEKRP